MWFKTLVKILSSEFGDFVCSSSCKKDIIGEFISIVYKEPTNGNFNCFLMLLITELLKN